MDAFWTDTAAVWSSNSFSIWVMTGSVAQAQLIHQGPRKDIGPCPGPAFSADGLRLYAWLDGRLGLTSIDVSTGTKTSLLRIPMHRVNYERFRHYDPVPVVGGPTVAESGPFLLALLQEESNDEAPEDDVDPARQGGHYIAFADRRERDQTAPRHPKVQMKGKAISWAWSGVRKELYIVAVDEGGTTVGVHRLSGELVRPLHPEVAGKATRVVLSPDETTLLVEYRSPDQRGRGGFVTIDLTSDAVQEGVRSGWGAAWSPNGNTIFYLDEWRLLQFDRSKRQSKLVAGHEPPIAEEVRYDARGPSLSSDGKRLAVNLGGNRTNLNGTRDVHTLFVDLERHEAVIVVDVCEGVVWSPVPRPIGAK